MKTLSPSYPNPPHPQKLHLSNFLNQFSKFAFQQMQDIVIVSELRFL